MRMSFCDVVNCICNIAGVVIAVVNLVFTLKSKNETV